MYLNFPLTLITIINIFHYYNLQKGCKLYFNTIFRLAFQCFSDKHNELLKSQSEMDIVAHSLSKKLKSNSSSKSLLILFRTDYRSKRSFKISSKCHLKENNVTENKMIRILKHHHSDYIIFLFCLYYNIRGDMGVEEQKQSQVRVDHNYIIFILFSLKKK